MSAPSQNLYRDYDRFEQLVQVMYNPQSGPLAAKQASDQLQQQFFAKAQPYDFCRFVFEHSYNSYSKSMAASMMRTALLREWSIVPVYLKAALSTYLISYVLYRGAQIDLSLRNQFLSCYAIIMKRMWLETYDGIGERFRAQFFATAQQMLAPAGAATVAAVDFASPQQVLLRVIGLYLLYTMANEFSSMKKSEIGLSFEFHERARVAFQREALPYAFYAALTLMQDSGKAVSYQQNEAKEGAYYVLKLAAKLLLEVLCSDFSRFDERSSLYRSIVAQRAHSSSKTGENMPEKLEPLDEPWKYILCNTYIVDLLAMLHGTVTDGFLAHMLRYCFVQMCSISTRSFPSEQHRFYYVEHLVNTLFYLLFSTMNRLLAPVKGGSNGGSAGAELLDWCEALLRIANTYRFDTLIRLPRLEEIMGKLSQVTVAIIDKSSANQFDEWLVDALDRLLEMWTSLCASFTLLIRSTAVVSPYMRQAMRDCCFAVYQRFVMSRVQQATNASGDDDEDDDEDYDEEEYLLEEYLQSLSALAREDPHRSAALLNELLTYRLALLERFVRGDVSAVGGSLKGFHRLCDYLEWIVQFSGFLLADESTGETPLVPDSIGKYAVELPTAENMVLQLVSNLVKFAYFEMGSLASGKKEHLSPRLAEKFLWFLSRWARTYLLPDEMNYSVQELAPLFKAAYGETQDGITMIDFLLKKSLSALFMWQGEPDLAKYACHLLKVLVSNERVKRVLYRLPDWVNLIASDHSTHASLNRYSDDIKGKLTECLCIGCCNPEQLALVTIPLRDQFFATVRREDFSKVFSQTAVIAYLNYCIEKLRGVARAAISDWSCMATFALFTDSSKILEYLLYLVHLYHNYEGVIRSILLFFSETVKTMNAYLSHKQCKLLFGVCIDVIEAYKHYNQAKIFTSRATAAEEEEEYFMDIVILLKLLTSMTSKDFLDFSSGNDDDEESLVGEVRVHQEELNVADVVFRGLNLVLPLINLEMLKYRDLCKQYFTLVSFMMEIHPERVAQLPSELFQQLAASISFGLKHHEHEIKRLSIEALQSIAEFHVKERMSGKPGLEKYQEKIPGLLDVFLRDVLQTVLFDSFDATLVESFGATLFAMMVWGEAVFNAAIESIINMEYDPVYRQRLAYAFANLRADITGYDRKNRQTFARNFDRLLFEARAITRKV